MKFLIIFKNFGTFQKTLFDNCYVLVKVKKGNFYRENTFCDFILINCWKEIYF